MRSLAREVVFKYIFSQLFNPGDEELFIVMSKDAKLNEADFSFANELLSYINNNSNKYLDVIKDLSIGYDLNRIFSSDKCALMIGIAELENYPNTPVPVIVDEALKLVSKYSSEKSTDFVNGILAKYCKNIGRN